MIPTGQFRGFAKTAADPDQQARSRRATAGVGAYPAGGTAVNTANVAANLALMPPDPALMRAAKSRLARAYGTYAAMGTGAAAFPYVICTLKRKFRGESRDPGRS